jgi:DnaJ-class molecular chaperone
MEPNYYAVLGVKETASPEEVQEAYRRLAKAYHPDRSGADTAGEFRAVQEAWETLGDPQRRRAYDLRRRHSHRPRPARRPPRAGPFAGARAPGWADFPFPQAAGALYLELQMTGAEADVGGDVEVGLPARVRCPHCGGRGRVAWFLCPGCDGRGHGLRVERFTLHIPAGLADGEVVRVPLAEHGLAYRELIIHVRVF